MSSVLNDIYSKCLAQENNISKEISKIVKNTYPINTIDRVKNKTLELLENYSSTINLLHISIENSKLSNEEKEIWYRKKECIQSEHKNLNKRLEESVYNIKKKNKKKFTLDFGDNNNNLELGQNISNLQKEKQGWNSILKMSTEIQSTAENVNSELDRQNISLSNIGGKVTTIFEKMKGSFNDTTWIKQRGKNDKLICLSLGLLTILIVCFTYFYLRPKIRKS